MFRIKIIFSISIFSILLIGTSIIKNQTRQIEKKISNLSSSILIKEKDLNETQLDLFLFNITINYRKKNKAFR